MIKGSQDILERYLRSGRSADFEEIVRAYGALVFGAALRRTGSRSFYPTSPLKEPFNSLFEVNPEEAIRLVRELCNHAMRAWRQNHRLSHREGSPLPLELTFPWGPQVFWGGDREFRWFRGSFGPNAVVCGLMALENWCFRELDRGQSPDELLEKIVTDNHSVAILGVASTLALAKEHVSAVTLPLFTSQRLLNADHKRRMEDISSVHANLICFSGSTDPTEIESVRELNKRPVRQKQTSWMVPLFTLGAEGFNDQARALLRDLPKNLQFEYEEQKKDSEAKREVLQQAQRFAELAEPSNYSIHRDSAQPDKIAIVHNSPSASDPRIIADAEAAQQRLTESSLGAWAATSLENGKAGELYTVEQAVKLAKEADSLDLQNEVDPVWGDLAAKNRTSAIAGTAAMVLSFREGLAEEELDWARGVLNEILGQPEESTPFWTHLSIDSTHPCLFAARGFGADLSFQTKSKTAAENLIQLVVHPHESVSIAALQESLKVCKLDPHLAWTSLKTALSLLHVPPLPEGANRTPNTPLHDPETLQSTVETALACYRGGDEWTILPSPPLAWIKSENSQISETQLADLDENDDIPEDWVTPPDFWHHQKAEKILKSVAIENLAQTPGKILLIEFFASLVEWTNYKNDPPRQETRNYARAPAEFMTWTRLLGRKLGVLASCFSVEELQENFLSRIFELKGDFCWALLSPFTDSFVCGSVFDSPRMPSHTVGLLELCLDRFLEHQAFKENSDSRHFRWDLDDSSLLESLMFVSVEKASLAARFVNGDWSEIEVVLPLVDRLIRAGFRQPRIVNAFLTLCERSREHYPTSLFVEQTQVILVDFENRQLGMEKYLVPSRIAELINFFTERDTPLELQTAQGILRILDGLVDFGDRRAAALQLSEAFREIRLS